MKTFSEDDQRYWSGLYGVDVLVVGTVSPFVGRGVDEPRDVKDVAVAEDGGNEIGVPKGFSP